ncbi:DsbA family oxidoreductase [Enterovirga rhinocerotis]|uniref:Putative DsbA family dithiol-disulfide isomerase n=1 Tax=Enterovirga rhinocerotis TaxID=1339210 RepID=A0A4R7BS04_9HYPH|nr:DsbA family oxidoreductase [Enterovirga rhinocerotis]TDR87245.1 putative DsbA family dithiol-disulfide isomerase [Enterovirga rhinocerotis]
MTLSIAVFSDVICPWCFIGKRRLEKALDELGLRGETTVEWLPFELNPDMPEEGMERAHYRAAKFGSERAATLDREMTARGAEEGIAFAFDRIARTPNTRKAHRLIAHASKNGRGEAVNQALLHAYFEEAREIGADDVLLAIAEEQGLDRAAAEAALSDPALGREIVALERRAGEIGVQGVPFFIVDHSWAVSGAQTPDQWIAALRQRTETGAAAE